MTGEQLENVLDSQKDLLIKDIIGRAKEDALTAADHKTTTIWDGETAIDDSEANESVYNEFWDDYDFDRNLVKIIRLKK